MKLVISYRFFDTANGSNCKNFPSYYNLKKFKVKMIFFLLLLRNVRKVLLYSKLNILLVFSAFKRNLLCWLKLIRISWLISLLHVCYIVDQSRISKTNLLNYVYVRGENFILLCAIFVTAKHIDIIYVVLYFFIIYYTSVSYLLSIEMNSFQLTLPNQIEIYSRFFEVLKCWHKRSQNAAWHAFNETKRSVNI